MGSVGNNAHEKRNELAANDFKDIDHDGDGVVTRADIQNHINDFLVAGRETQGHIGAEDVSRTVDAFMAEMGDTDGRISWDKFSEWNRNNTFGDFVRHSLASSA